MKALQKEVMSELAELQSLPVVTPEELAKHVKADDAWVLIDSVVYNVSKFHALHPGGSLLLLKYAGKDATEDFKMMHTDMVLRRPEYKRLRVGRIDIAALSPQEQKRLFAARVQEKWLPFSQPYWLDPRGTLVSPYYNEFHRKWQKKASEFIQTEIRPFADKWDEDGKYPMELHDKAYKAGIYAPMWPVEYGGTPPEGGWDAFMDLIYLYEMGQTGAGGIMASWFLTGNIALPPVINHGSKELKDRVARDVVTGKAVMALAITEPWAGSDVANLRCSAVEDGDSFVINGEKKFITSGLTAQYFTVACRTDPTKHGHNGISLILVEATRPGIDRKKIKTMGWWAGNTSYITFENVRVPKSNLIGELNHGFRYIMENFNHERFVACVGAACGGHKAIRECIKFARVRKTFGKRLIDHQAIRHKIADMAMRTEAHFAWCEQMAYFMKNKAPEVDLGSRVALAKVNGTLLLEFCAREACQILGGNSYARQGHGQSIERMYREVRVTAIGGGSEEIMRDLGMRMSKL